VMIIVMMIMMVVVIMIKIYHTVNISYIKCRYVWNYNCVPLLLSLYSPQKTSSMMWLVVSSLSIKDS